MSGNGVTTATRYVADLPFDAVQDGIRRGAVAVLPTGSTECHGRRLPQGTDTFIVNAVAERVAAACDGLIFPPISYSYSGGTGRFDGTITLPGRIEQEYTRAVLRRLVHDGWRRILHLQWHGPYYSNQQLAREFFEEMGAPVLYVGLMQMPVMRSPEMLALLSSDHFTSETRMAVGALEQLGRLDLLRGDAGQSDEQTVKRPEDPALQRIAAGGGVVGHFYNHPSQHLAVRLETDVDSGRKALRLLADAVIDLIPALNDYVRILQERSPAGGSGSSLVEGRSSS